MWNYSSLEDQKDLIIKLMLDKMPDKQFSFTKEELQLLKNKIIYDGYFPDGNFYRLSLLDSVPLEF